MTNKNKIIIGTPIKNKIFPVGVGFSDLSPTPPSTNYLLTNDGNIIVTNIGEKVIING